MAKRDFKEIPKAAQPGQVPVGTAQVDIDKYITDQVKDPKIAQAAQQSYTAQTVQQNELLGGQTMAAPTAVGGATLTAPTIVGGTPATATTIGGPTALTAPTTTVATLSLIHI